MTEIEDLQRKVDGLLRQALDHPDAEARVHLIDEAARWNQAACERIAAVRAQETAAPHLRVVSRTESLSTDARLGVVIARVRRTRALTIADVARKLGVSEAEAAGYETGAHRIPAARLAQIALVLGVSVTAILRDADDLH